MCVCVCVLISSFTTIIVTGVSLVLSIPTSLRCFDALFTYFEKKRKRILKEAWKPCYLVSVNTLSWREISHLNHSSAL